LPYGPATAATPTTPWEPGKRLENDAEALPHIAGFATDVRRNRAYWLFLADRHEEGLALIRRVSVEYHNTGLDTAVYGMAARTALAHAVGEAGDPAAALHHARQVMADCVGLDQHHEVALAARYEVARWTGRCGDRDTAVSQLRPLLDQVRSTLGNTHSLALDCRDELDTLNGSRPSPMPDHHRYWLRLAHW
jgi:hypothetical protein